MSRIDYKSFVIWIPQKTHLPIGQVKNRIHQLDSKNHHENLRQIYG